MKKIPASTAKEKSKKGISGKIRDIADRLQQETEVQKKATVRILAAAAQISHNHEQLIDEVVEMVEEDLEAAANMKLVEVYTVEFLKQKFKTLRNAKQNLNIKANSWQALADKLNDLAIANPHIDINTLLDNQSLNNIEKEQVREYSSNNERESSKNYQFESDRYYKPNVLNVSLESDVAEFFPNSQAVNEALRFLIRVTNQQNED